MSPVASSGFGESPEGTSELARTREDAPGKREAPRMFAARLKMRREGCGSGAIAGRLANGHGEMALVLAGGRSRGPRDAPRDAPYGSSVLSETVVVKRPPLGF